MKLIVINTILVLFLASCAGIGIPNSSDAYKKLEYSYQAMSQERYIPANRLILEAIEIFKKNNDTAGLAEAYATYGNFHKRTFKADTLSKKPDPQEAIKYFNLAINEFTKIGDKNGVAKCHMGIGSAYMNTNKAQGCKHYDIAINTYDPNGIKFPINPSFKDFPEMVKSFKDKYCN